MSEIQDLKAVEESTGVIEYAQGHSSAHGFGIAASNLDTFIDKMNEFYKDVPTEPIYWVDYIWKSKDVTSDKLLAIAEMASYWGQDIPASQVAVEDINLSQCSISLCGAKKNTVRIILPNDVVFVKFGVIEEEYEQMIRPNTYMTCVVSPSKNEYMGRISGEGFVDNYELKTKWIF